MMPPTSRRTPGHGFFCIRLECGHATFHDPVELSNLVQKHQGLGQMGLRIFLAADTDPGIRAAARHLETNKKIQPSADSA